MNRILITTTFLLSSLVLPAGSMDSFFNNADDFFRDHVKYGNVNYTSLKSNHSQLKNLIEQIGSVTLPADLTERKAFYINAYNILVIHSTVTNYPVKSVMDIPGFFNETKHTIAGKLLTLDQLEKQTLMKEFYDVRLHFILVCAARSCPPLPSYAYMPETLESQILSGTKKTLNDVRFIKPNNGAKQVNVSKIFDWYKSDFTKNGETILSFLNKYRNSKIPSDWKLGYYEYDWRLNDLK